MSQSLESRFPAVSSASPSGERDRPRLWI